MENIPKYNVAVVTGGGKGLGRAIALALGKDGYEVILLGRGQEEMTAVAGEITALGGRCSWQPCDVGDWVAVELAFNNIKAEQGNIDVLVNNAGGWVGSKLTETDPEVIDSLTKATLYGTLYCSRAAIPLMGKGSTILNIGSSSALESSTDVAVSSAPKAAVASFSRAMAQELKGSGIRTCVIHPTGMSTDAPSETNLNYDQVASVVSMVLKQPENVALREIIVTSSDETY